MNVLLTSFDPFGAEVQNSSLEILRRLPDRLEGISLVKEVLPTQFAVSYTHLDVYKRQDQSRSSSGNQQIDSAPQAHHRLGAFPRCILHEVDRLRRDSSMD